MSASYQEPLVDIAILDYERPRELEKLILSLRANALFEHRVVYLANGGTQDYADQWYASSDIDVMIRNRVNVGCGLATRQIFQSCMARYVIYVQVDQWLARPIQQAELDHAIAQLTRAFHVDLAGDQGRGRFSERAFLTDRKRYLSIPGLDTVIGGPGPYAQSKWTEQHVQEHIAANAMSFSSASPLWFADNGKVSIREYGSEYGGKTMHYTDEKRLFVLEPFHARADGFPNLNLSDGEWADVLAGRWPVEGKIPEADKAHSFVYWKTETA